MGNALEPCCGGRNGGPTEGAEGKQTISSDLISITDSEVSPEITASVLAHLSGSNKSPHSRQRSGSFKLLLAAQDELHPKVFAQALSCVGSSLPQIVGCGSPSTTSYFGSVSFSHEGFLRTTCGPDSITFQSSQGEEPLSDHGTRASTATTNGDAEEKCHWIDRTHPDFYVVAVPHRNITQGLLRGVGLEVERTTSIPSIAELAPRNESFIAIHTVKLIRKGKPSFFARDVQIGDVLIGCQSYSHQWSTQFSSFAYCTDKKNGSIHTLLQKMVSDSEDGPCRLLFYRASSLSKSKRQRRRLSSGSGRGLSPRPTDAKSPSRSMKKLRGTVIATSTLLSLQAGHNNGAHKAAEVSPRGRARASSSSLSDGLRLTDSSQDEKLELYQAINCTGDQMLLPKQVRELYSVSCLWVASCIELGRSAGATDSMEVMIMLADTYESARALTLRTCRAARTVLDKQIAHRHEKIQFQLYSIIVRCHYNLWYMFSEARNRAAAADQLSLAAGVIIKQLGSLWSHSSMDLPETRSFCQLCSAIVVTVTNQNRVTGNSKSAGHDLNSILQKSWALSCAADDDQLSDVIAQSATATEDDLVSYKDKLFKADAMTVTTA